MVRLLTQADRAQALTLLNRDPHHNLYLLGNIAKLGFAHALTQFWGDFGGGTGVLHGILNRYMNGWAVYGLPGTDWSALGAILDEHPIQAVRLQDNPGGVISLLPFLTAYTCKALVVEELMCLSPEDFRPIALPYGVHVRRAVASDLPALVAFYAEAGDMARTPEAVARPLQDTRIWLAEEEGEILSAALTNAETDALAMIGGVFSKPAARNRGLSQAVCSALCQELLAIECQPVLYWRHLAAGRVYQKLGFRTIGDWRAVWLQAK